MAATASLVPVIGVSGACLALGVPRATFYRWRRDGQGDHRQQALRGAGGAAETRSTLRVCGAPVTALPP